MPATTPTVRLALLAVLSAPASALAQSRAQADSTRAQSLNKVVTSASGSSQKSATAPAAISIVTRSQLLEQRSGTLAEALRLVEGVDVGDTQGKTGGLNISIRGMPSEYTLILIDGRRQNTAGSIAPNGFGETSTSFLPPVSAIERIEVVRGPLSTLYGSDGIGGVINIITRRNTPRWSGSATSDATLQQVAGFGNVYNGSVHAAGPLGTSKLRLAVRGSLMERAESALEPTGAVGATTTISARGPSPVAGWVRGGGARLSWLPSPRHEIALDADVARQRYDNTEAQLGTLDRPDASPASFNGYGPELRFNREQVALTHSWRLGGGRLESSLMRNLTATIGRTLPSGTPGGPPGSGAPNKPAGAPRTLESTSDVLDTRYVAPWRAHVTTVGGQYWDADMIDGVALQPFAQTQWSVFAEDQWALPHNVQVTMGIRQDQHDAFGGQTTPRVYAVWQATPSLTIKSGVSTGYKTPRLEQLVDGIIGFGAQGRTALIGTPGLTPERSVNSEIGMAYEHASGVDINLALFNNEFRDKITAGTPIANCTFAAAPNRDGCVNYGSFPTQEFFSQSVNVDRAVTRGGEASIHLPLKAGWNATANYTHTFSEQLSGPNNGFPLANTPRHMMNARVGGALTSRIDVWANGEYRSSRARRVTAATNAAWSALGDFKPYSLMHVGANVRLYRGLSTRIAVNNLFNTDFLQFGSYTSNNQTVYTSLYNNHQEGRRIWLQTAIDF